MVVNRASKSVTCLQCDVEFQKSLKECRRSPNHFCSRSCSVTYNNIHGKRRNKRSKFEQWIAMRLSEAHRDLEILYNDRKRAGIGLELDIYIPELSLAFELNGPVHYKPIYGDGALKKTKERDRLKAEACKQKEIKLVVVDVSDMKRFKSLGLVRHTEFILSEVKKQIETLQG